MFFWCDIFFYFLVPFYLLFLSNKNSTPWSATSLFADKSWHMFFFSSNLSEQMFLGGIVCSASNELWKFPLELQALKLWCAWSVIVGNFHYLYFWNVLIPPLDFARKPCFCSLWKGNTRCQIWCTIELHRDPISKVLLEW